MTERRKVALVTGASRGIGRAIAERLAADGYHAVLTYRADAAGADAAVAGIQAAGGSAEAAKADAASREETTALLDRLDKEFEGVDVLVNNAAVLKNGLFALMPEASWNLVMETALGGAFRATKGVIRNMIRRRWGRIVNVSSLAAFSGSAGQTNYSAAKGAIVSFTKSLAAEVGPYNITVNAIAPGFIDTELTGSLDDDGRRRIAGRSALRRLPEADDVASMVEYLLGEGGRNITGTVLTVDAGNTA